MSNLPLLNAYSLVGERIEYEVSKEWARANHAETLEEGGKLDLPLDADFCKRFPQFAELAPSDASITLEGSLAKRPIMLENGGVRLVIRIDALVRGSPDEAASHPVREALSIEMPETPSRSSGMVSCAKRVCMCLSGIGVAAVLMLGARLAGDLDFI